MSMSTNEGNITRVTVDLLITNVSREDTGVYECLAINLLSNVTRNISLIVQCMQSFVCVDIRNYSFLYYMIIHLIDLLGNLCILYTFVCIMEIH